MMKILLCNTCSNAKAWATQYNPEEVLISLMINMNPGCPQFSKYIYIYIYI